MLQTRCEKAGSKGTRPKDQSDRHLTPVHITMSDTDSDKSNYKALADKAWDQLRFWALEDDSWKESFTKEEVVVTKYVAL